MLPEHGSGNELRHLRYFVAVAEAGNLTVAAQNAAHVTAFVESADSSHPRFAASRISQLFARLRKPIYCPIDRQEITHRTNGK
jgi:hypothetical protein